MRVWIPLIVLGVIGLVVGGLLVGLHLHRTIGLGGLGLGALLVIIGLAGTLLGRRGSKTQDVKTTAPALPKGAGRKAIIAILVVVVIGVGTFYGTSYLSSIQPGTSASQSPITSTVSGTIPTGSGVSSGTSQSSSQATSQSSVQTTPLASCSTPPKIALDGSAIEYNGSGSSASVVLTTSKSPDLIVLYVTAIGNPVGSNSTPPAVINITDSSSGLSFQRRASVVTSTVNAGINRFSVEEWYAVANGTLAKDPIVVKMSSSSPVITIIAFGISSANTTAPFDSVSPLPGTATGEGNGTISSTISTKSPIDMVIGGAAMSSVSPAAGSGYTLIASDGGNSTAQDPIADYAVTCANGSNYSVTFNNEHADLGGVQTWAMIADAVAEANQTQ